MKTKQFVPPSKEKPKTLKEDSVTKMIDNGEPNEVFMTSWAKHVGQRHEIKSCSTIIGDKLYQITARPNEVILPYTEFFGDHSENWVVVIDKISNAELLRKNTKYVDMIEWKLSSSQTNPKK